MARLIRGVVVRAGVRVAMESIYLVRERNLLSFLLAYKTVGFIMTFSCRLY